MEVSTLLILFAGGIVAGAVTAVAGGSSFLTFPLLIAAGLPPLTANITNWIALMPGNFMALAAYRDELRAMRGAVRAHLLVSFAGGLLGGGLLLWTGEARFEKAVPWLILTATVFFALGEWIKTRLDALRRPGQTPSRRWLLAFEFVLMVYGGYFGAGVGIVLLAALAIAGQTSIHMANAQKNLMVVALSAAGCIVLLPSGHVAWWYALPMFAGSSLGGYGAVRFIRRIPARAIRNGMLAWAVLLTIYSFWKYG
ncbi:MAG: sulfite exporter TauE/SafE family protein [Rhodoferax sp.]|nr:sulfite exporter TauE/SafE family protein [Rhodoferax sp.]